MSGKIDHNGPPLDFSFLNLQEISQLKKERPRPGGKRKPIPPENDDDENKKNDLAGVADGEKVEGGEQ